MVDSSTLRGQAGLHVAKVRDRSTVINSWSRSPLTLLTPRCSAASVWAYTSSFGGGMVAGDETSLSVQIDPGARCFLSTQASTKVYRNPAQRPCSHRTDVQLGAGALLVFVPDPVQCFAEASYRQAQNFALAADAGLVLVDWLSSGRTARGERWAFRDYRSQNSVRRAGRLIFHDALRLEHSSAPLANRFRTGRFNALATVLILGPDLGSSSAHVLAEYRERRLQPNADLVVSASPLAEGAVLRLAGIDLEQVGREISRILSFVPKLLQADPWARKW